MRFYYASKVVKCWLLMINISLLLLDMEEVMELAVEQVYLR